MRPGGVSPLRLEAGNCYAAGTSSLAIGQNGRPLRLIASIEFKKDHPASGTYQSRNDSPPFSHRGRSLAGYICTAEALVRIVSMTSVVKLMTRARLCIDDSLLDRLAQDLEDMAAEFGELIQEEHAVVGQ